jgi:hypothetical protein
MACSRPRPSAAARIASPPFGRYQSRFRRIEQRTNATVVIYGLTGGLQRNTCEPIAVEAGVHRKPIQFLVGAGKWDVEFREGWWIAAELIERARSGLLHGWVIGDDEFGRPRPVPGLAPSPRRA